jgi:hypothetical protein
VLIGIGEWFRCCEKQSRFVAAGCCLVLGEVIDDLCEIVEGVREFVSRWHGAVAIAGVVGRDDVVFVSERGDQVAEHLRTCREVVQEQDPRGILWACLPIEDVEAVHETLTYMAFPREHWSRTRITIAKGFPPWGRTGSRRQNTHHQRWTKPHSYGRNLTNATSLAPGCRFMSNELHLSGDGTDDLGATRTAAHDTRYLAVPASSDRTPRRQTGQATTRVTRARTAR